MAAPSNTVWGSIVGGYGRIGISVTFTDTATTRKADIGVWFWSKYSVSDQYNTLYYDRKLTSGAATTSRGNVSINTTVDSGAGWSTSNQVKIWSDSVTHTRGTSATTIYLAAKLQTVERVGGITYASMSYTVPALASYKVSYNANGGSGAPSAHTKYYGKTLTLSSTKPTRTGYIFKGWATSASGSVAYASGASYTANAAVTLYAVWQKNTYTVSYNANGGTGATTVTDALENLGLTAYVTPQMFGAAGNANYYNESDNQWYVDENYTTLATNDTQAFTDALNAAVNKTLYIPKGEGEYYLLKGLYIPSNVKIVTGNGAKVVFDYTSTFGFSINDKENIHIDGSGDFEIKMVRGNSSYSVNHAIRLYGSNHITIENLIIRDACYNGIEIGDGTIPNEYITIKNVEIYNSRGNNLYIKDGKHILVDSCIFNDIQGSDSISPRSGFIIEPGTAASCVVEDVRVLNCTASNNKGQGFFCRYSFKDITFENCIAENNANNYSTSGSTDRIHENVTFLNCRSIDSTGSTTEDGFVTASTDNVKIIGCHAEGEGHGFNIYTKSNRVIVDSCISINSRQDAFYVGTASNAEDSFANDVTVSNCIAENCGGGYSLQYCADVIIDSCIADTANKGHGVSIVGKNCKVVNNIIKDSVYAGVNVGQNTTDITIHSNQLIRNKACGILIYGGSRVMVDGNYLLNNSIYTRDSGISFTYYNAGIKIQGGDDCIITSNKIRITEETTVKSTAVSCHLYGQTTNCYIADNDCYTGGYYSYEITGSTDYGNVNGGGNRKTDGTILA